MKTKAQIARKMYGVGLSSLNPGQKGAVTRAYNAQEESDAQPAATQPGYVTATIGRAIINGTKTCVLAQGSTVNDLVSQSGYDINTKKEGILAKSTGNVAKYDDKLRDGETYIIVVGVDSSC